MHIYESHHPNTANINARVHACMNRKWLECCFVHTLRWFLLFLLLWPPCMRTAHTLLRVTRNFFPLRLYSKIYIDAVEWGFLSPAHPTCICSLWQMLFIIHKFDSEKSGKKKCERGQTNLPNPVIQIYKDISEELRCVWSGKKEKRITEHGNFHCNVFFYSTRVTWHPYRQRQIRARRVKEKELAKFWQLITKCAVKE